jgi:hypothetical protein
LARYGSLRSKLRSRGDSSAHRPYATMVAVAFAPDGLGWPLSARMAQARIFHAAPGAELAHFDHHDWIDAVVFAANGARVAIGSADDWTGCSTPPPLLSWHASTTGERVNAVKSPRTAPGRPLPVRTARPGCLTPPPAPNQPGCIMTTRVPAGAFAPEGSRVARGPGLPQMVQQDPRRHRADRMAFVAQILAAVGIEKLHTTQRHSTSHLLVA